MKSYLKSFLTILLCFVCAFSSIAQTQFNAQVNATNFAGLPAAIQRVVLTPTNFFFTTNFIPVQTPIVGVTDTNGSYTFTNTYSGCAYTLEIDTSFTTVFATLGFPAGLTGTVNVAAYQGIILSNGIFAYTSTNFYQSFSTNLAGWSLLSTNAVAYLAQLSALSNSAFSTLQPANINLSNFANVPIANVALKSGTNVFSGTNSFNTNTYFANVNLSLSTGFTPVITLYDQQYIQWLTANGLTVLSTLEMNAGHGGGGNGSELQWPFNQMTLGMASWLQIGEINPANLTCMYMERIGESSSLVPSTSSAMFGWLYSFYNGGAEYTALVDTQAVPFGTNGHAVIYFSNPVINGNPNSPFTNTAVRIYTSPTSSTSGLGYSGRLTRDVYASSPGTTNYGVNWDTTNEVVLSLSANLNLTNIPTAYPWQRTNQSDGVAVYIYPGLPNYMLTVPTNWFTNSSFSTNIAGSQVMKLNVRQEVIGAVTNYYADQTTYNYTPATDPLAATFFATTGLTTAGTKNAVNALCVGLRADGLLAGNKFIELWPMVGLNAATNAVGLNGHNIIWHGSITHNANGVTFDGSTGYGDIGLIPTNIFAANSSAMLFVYNRTASLSGTQVFMGALDSSPTVYFGVNCSSSTFVGALGLNLNSQADGINIGGAYAGFISVNRTATSSQTIYANGTSVTLTDLTATGLGQTYSVYIGARNGQGTADNFSAANLDGAGLFQNLSAGDVTNLKGLMAAFNTALGR